VDPEASAVTESGAFPVDGVTTREAVGGWLGGKTVIAVEAELELVFDAVKATL
jgi:hypothetical protein